MTVLDIGIRQAQRIVSQVREHVGKETHHRINVQEFCEYTGLKIEDVFESLGWELWKYFITIAYHTIKNELYEIL